MQLDLADKSHWLKLKCLSFFSSLLHHLLLPKSDLTVALRLWEGSAVCLSEDT